MSNGDASEQQLEQKNHLRNLARKYEATLAGMERALVARSSREASLCMERLRSCAEEINAQGVGWDSINAILEHGPYNTEARRLLQERYADWVQNETETPAGADVIPAAHRSRARSVQLSTVSARSTTSMMGPLPPANAGRFIDATKPPPLEEASGCWPFGSCSAASC